jgi:hypothetical protein
VLVSELVSELVQVQVLVQNCRLRLHHMNKEILKIMQQIDVMEIAFPKCIVLIEKRYK